MTRFDVVKTFIFKTVIPIMFVFFMYQIFIDLCVSVTTTNYLYLLMICGIPFGIKYMFMLPILVRSMGVGIAMMIFNIAIGSLIGGFILLWKLTVALYYIPLSIVRFARA